MSEATGKADFVVGTETFQTWYKVVGDLKSGVRPVVVLHGGPGIPHQYMTPNLDLWKTHGIPVVIYDQLGCGLSTHLRDKPKEFWSVELFMDELENLVVHLGISSDYALLGHSWGGMLSANYVCARQPPGLKLLVLMGTPASMKLWQEGTRQLLEGLPEDVKKIIKKHEEDGTTSDPEYQKAIEVFMGKHVCRLNPLPQEMLDALAAQMADPTVYFIMNGPSEFYITGTIKTWSVLDQLSTITQPTLLINGVYDEATDLCVAPLFEKIPKAKWVQFGSSAHMAHFEERERYLKIVGDFLTAY